MRQAVVRFLAICTSNPLSLIGTGLTSVSAFLFLLLVIIHAMSERGGGPYLGILTFLILPAPFVLGLVLWVLVGSATLGAILAGWIR